MPSERRPLGALLLVGTVLLPLVPLALVCSVGTLFVIADLLVLPSKSPFAQSPALGVSSVALLGLLAAFLVTVAWRLLTYLLGGKEAPYLIHPVVGVVLGVLFGVTSAAAFGFTLASGGSLRYLAAAPILFLGFAWQQARRLRSRRASAGASP